MCLLTRPGIFVCCALELVSSHPNNAALSESLCKERGCDSRLSLRPYLSIQIRDNLHIHIWRSPTYLTFLTFLLKRFPVWRIDCSNDLGGIPQTRDSQLRGKIVYCSELWTYPSPLYLVFKSHPLLFAYSRLHVFIICMNPWLCHTTNCIQLFFR